MPKPIDIKDGILSVQVAYYVETPEEALNKGLDPDAAENRVWRKHTFDLKRKPATDWGEARSAPEYVRVVFSDGDRRMLRLSHQAFERMYLKWLREQPVLPWTGN